MNANVNKSVGIHTNHNKQPRFELLLSYYYFLTEFNSNKDILSQKSFVVTTNYKPVWNVPHTYHRGTKAHCVLWLLYPNVILCDVIVSSTSSWFGPCSRTHKSTTLSPGNTILRATLAVTPVKVSMETWTSVKQWGVEQKLWCLNTHVFLSLSKPSEELFTWMLSY